jgi:hypothetical protein
MIGSSTEDLMRWFAALIFSASVLSASRADAQLQLAPPPPPPSLPALPTGEDVLTLRDGTILRGHVTEMRPGDHVEIVLLDGRSQVVPWAQLAASEGPSFPLVRANPAARFVQPSPGRVPVVVESERASITVGVLAARPLIGQDTTTVDDGAEIAQWTESYQSRNGIVVCPATPCRIFARPGELMLQVSGEGVLSYGTQVTIPPAGARLTMRAPSLAARRAGSTLIWLAPGTLISGAVMLALAATFGGDSASPGSPAAAQANSMSTTYYALGGALMGVGVGVLVAGIVLWARNRTGVASLTPLSEGIRF